MKVSQLGMQINEFSTVLAEMLQHQRTTERQVESLSTQVGMLTIQQPTVAASRSTRVENRDVQRQNTTLHDLENLNTTHDGSGSSQPGLANYQGTLTRQAVGHSSPRGTNSNTALPPPRARGILGRGNTSVAVDLTVDASAGEMEASFLAAQQRA